MAKMGEGCEQEDIPRMKGWSFLALKESMEELRKMETRRRPFMKETLCYYTDFLGNILGKLENDASNIGHVTFTYLCPHCKNFPRTASCGG